jgi:hypothetical protein
MGVRVDNYLIETLAVAVSYEVSVRMGMTPYVQSESVTEALKLPTNCGHECMPKNTLKLRAYWQSQISLQSNRVDDRAFQTLGAALILQRNVE